MEDNANVKIENESVFYGIVTATIVEHQLALIGVVIYYMVIVVVIKKLIIVITDNHNVSKTVVVSLAVVIIGMVTDNVTG